MSDGKGTTRPGALKLNKSPESAPGGVNDSRAPAGQGPDRDGPAAGVLEERALAAEARHDDDDYDDDDSLRGIVVVPVKKKVLFSDRVELRISELPRWKPEIILDDRTLERLEDSDE